MRLTRDRHFFRLPLILVRVLPGCARNDMICTLPGVVDLVRDDLLLAGGDLDAELDGLAVGLGERVGLLHDLPVDPAVQVLDDADLDGALSLRLRTLISKDSSSQLRIGVDLVVRPAALADEVEGVARVDADGLILAACGRSCSRR